MESAKISDMKVERLLHMGDDLFVVNCARVTLGKMHPEFMELEDTRLINFLSREDHWTPFAHPHMTFRVKAPIFVARQLAKSQVGFVWNEVSRRYVDVTPEFYMPELRKRAPGVKQGSADEVVDTIGDKDGVSINARFLCEKMLSLYNQFYETLIDNDVAPECSRAYLPQSMMTEWIWTGSLYGFARVCNLRMATNAQKESGIVTREISKHLHELFPVSAKALLRYN